MCAKIGVRRESSRGCGGDKSTSLTTRLQTAINGILGFLRENRRILGNSWANKGIIVRFGATIDQKRDKTVYKGTKRQKPRPTMAVEWETPRPIIPDCLSNSDEYRPKGRKTKRLSGNSCLIGWRPIVPWRLALRAGRRIRGVG